MNGNLVVKPLQAQLHTEVYEVVGRLDTYCVITVGPKTHKTRTANNMGKNPHWKDALEFDFNSTMSMSISLWDQDSSGEADFIGSTEIEEVEALIDKINPTHWIPIYKKNPFGKGPGMESGRVLLQVEFYPLNQPGYEVAWRVEHFADEAEVTKIPGTDSLTNTIINAFANNPAFTQSIAVQQTAYSAPQQQQVLPQSIAQQNYSYRSSVQQQHSNPIYTISPQYQTTTFSSYHTQVTTAPPIYRPPPTHTIQTTSQPSYHPQPYTLPLAQPSQPSHHHHTYTHHITQPSTHTIIDSQPIDHHQSYMHRRF